VKKIESRPWSLISLYKITKKKKKKRKEKKKKKNQQQQKPSALTSLGTG
jgi:hypothetical protein